MAFSFKKLSKRNGQNSWWKSYRGEEKKKEKKKKKKRKKEEETINKYNLSRACPTSFLGTISGYKLATVEEEEEEEEEEEDHLKIGVLLKNSSLRCILVDSQPVPGKGQHLFSSLFIF